MKKFFKAFPIITALCISLAISCSAQGPLLGDVNGDGMLNSDDAVFLLRHTLDSAKYPINQSGNMNGDSTLDSNDAIYLLRHTLDNEKYPILSCGHAFEEFSAKEPTCTSVGWSAYKVCSLCGYSTYEEKGVIPHTYVDGYCKFCEKPYLSPNGFHAHSNRITDATDSTCVKNGFSEQFVCTDCGKILVKSLPLPLKPHDFLNGVCNLCGGEQTPSQGLEFGDDGAGGMTLVGIGECTDTQIVVPATHNGKAVTTIVSNAFNGNSNIVQIVIPSSVKIIGEGAFKRCTELADVVLNKGLVRIEKEAFMYCTALKSVKIPDSVTRLGNAAFIACYNLNEATLGSGITKINEDLFFECYRMKTLNISAPLTSVGGWALFDCDSLEAINYNGTKAEWQSIKYGSFWDENSGDYVVFCSDNQSAHKHIYNDWYETSSKCELERSCTRCSYVNRRYNHSATNVSWVTEADTVSQKCNLCNNPIVEYQSNGTLLKLDFSTPVSTQLASYKGFTLVSDKNNSYVTDNGRSAWKIGSTTFIDYGKETLYESDMVAVSFDMKVSQKGDTMRDTSVFSFVAGMKDGKKVGSSVTHHWLVKYIPVLDKLSTKALNGTDIPYPSIDLVPNPDDYNSTNTVAMPTNKWVTVNAICDLEKQLSYIFVDGTYIGRLNGINYGDEKYSEAFTLRFCDNAAHTTLFDNFKMVSYAKK